jgi:5-methylcytosine-specific restriction endonuclease McrA
METLVLDIQYAPVARVSWQRAITLLWEGKVEVVEEYEDRKVRSVTLEFRMPAVIRFLRMLGGKRKGVRFSRESVYARDRGRCQYCSVAVPRHDFTYDHVVPRSHHLGERGGVVHALQPEKGRAYAGAGGHDAEPCADSAEVPPRRAPAHVHLAEGHAGAVEAVAPLGSVLECRTGGLRRSRTSRGRRPGGPRPPPSALQDAFTSSPITSRQAITKAAANTAATSPAEAL